jgi:hypothetical protein
MKYILGMMMLVVSLSASAFNSGDACRINPENTNERLVLTMEPCPVTTNSQFLRAYYTVEDKNVVAGEACWIGDSKGVLVLVENKGTYFFDPTDFKDCE